MKMNLVNLNNLVKIGKLKSEPFNQKEFEGLVNSGQNRLKDASNEDLAIESRFDLAYNAAHALALAALRKKGYRSNYRYVVFQVLPHTLGVSMENCRILSKCHDLRNVAEYEGHLEINDQLLNELLSATKILLERLGLV